MSQRKAIPIKRVFPIEQGFFLEFFSEADADCFYQRCLEVGSRVERVDRLAAARRAVARCGRVTITIKSTNVKSSESGAGGQDDE